MANLQEQTSSIKSNSKNKQHKKSTRVDLTPMVDLGFLLITFFVFTSTMAKPTVMKVAMPFDNKFDHDNVCISCVLTVLPAHNNLVYYYEGAFTGKNMQQTNFYGIRQIIQQKKIAVAATRGNDNQFVLIIKPTNKASFKNFVDITDEVTINRVAKYYIDEALPIELAVL
jgi:biopolymer transport protein ExbD